MLLDELMPRYDVVERHRIAVRAEREAVFAAIRTADLSGGVLTRTLLGLRMVPAALIALARSPGAALKEWRDRRSRATGRLADFERAGFRVVGERAPGEIVIGLLGRFWTPRGGLCAELDARMFAEAARTGPPRGQALAGWNFSVHSRPDGRSELRTETRVWCAPDARSRFIAYWMVVRPGSGLIRRSMLRAIRQVAERSVDDSHASQPIGAASSREERNS